MSDNRIESDKIFIKNAFEWWYRVPEYQRPYVWGTDQVNDLLEDVAYGMSTKPNAEYFLGSIVLQKRLVADAGKEYQENDLLDGQQRLTTCLMLHAVARDMTSNKKLQATCRETIFQEENPFDGIPERLRIVYDIRDDVRDFVTKFLKPDGGTDDQEALKTAQNSKDASVRNMANAIIEIRRYFSQPDAPRLEQFFPFFRNKVLLIYVASTQLEDAFRLFTVLNDRGMRLRNSDILKTMNLRALKEADASPSDQKNAAQAWEEMEGELGEDFDTFLSHVRTVLVKEKARLNLLQEFENNIYDPSVFEQDTKTYKKVPPLLLPGRQTFEFIKRYRNHHLQVLSGNNFHLAKSWEFDNLVSLLKDAGLADFWVPPLLHYREIFGDERIIEFLRKLENKFCADWIARETPTTRVEAMNTILAKIDEVRTLPNTPKSGQIETLLSSTVFDYNNAELTKQLDTAAIYGRRFARYILYKLDMIYGGTGYRLQPPKDISVEHVLPQNPAEDSQWCKDFTAAQREEWTDRLGNLVLISRRKNTSQGRLDFTEKKQRYFKENIEPFPSSIRVLKNTNWTPAILQTNHVDVLRKLCEYTGVPHGAPAATAQTPTPELPNSATSSTQGHADAPTAQTADAFSPSLPAEAAVTRARVASFSFQYWTGVLKALQPCGILASTAKATRRQDNIFEVGWLHFWLKAYFSIPYKQAGVWVSCRGPRGLEAYRTLIAAKEQVEKSLGHPLQWHLYDLDRGGSLGLTIEDIDATNSADWPRQHELLASKLAALYCAVAPLVNDFDTEAKPT